MLLKQLEPSRPSASHHTTARLAAIFMQENAIDIQSIAPEHRELFHGVECAPPCAFRPAHAS